MTKNIVSSATALANEFGESNSNVVRLYKMLVHDASQIAYTIREWETWNTKRCASSRPEFPFNSHCPRMEEVLAGARRNTRGSTELALGQIQGRCVTIEDQFLRRHPSSLPRILPSPRL
jgi:hypothetical protein